MRDPKGLVREARFVAVQNDVSQFVQLPEEQQQTVNQRERGSTYSYLVGP